MWIEVGLACFEVLAVKHRYSALVTAGGRRSGREAVIWKNVGHDDKIY